ncbi:MAG: saccharopine dehydrogenase [Pelagibacteraceae bacterium]|nr:saccharopine dehydrogenase [Pelagibacteraceae bacterium]|tara:strand:- start:26389 stop:27519 length:1131 start_codon:yes stop_codon:yes gene_type:complete
MKMKKIHWIGAGLSSVPGIRRLASTGQNITVWNRTLEKAKNSINHVSSENVKAKELNFENLKKEINKNDIVISQLSANLHIKVAKICLEKDAHFASTSYLSQEIRDLHEKAKSKKLVFINEIGLDPGIDHFFTHLLVDELKKQNLGKIDVIYKSYCGGIPADENDFKYKFSWSPLGVLKALNNTAEFIENFEYKKISRPYEHLSKYKINNEYFELYPNRNSIPYIDEYLFEKEWKVKEFIRGTLRLNGWSEAWSNIFKMLNSNIENIEDDIIKKSDELWKEFKYKENEKDRVVLWVNLKAQKNSETLWSKTFHLDEQGSGENTAMAKLVSITLSAVIDLMIENKIEPGVQAAPHKKDLINYIFGILNNYSITINQN